MSNLETRPDERVCVPGARDQGELAGCRPPDPPELVAPREVPLGGPRAMTVRRTLPRRQRSLIGAWCFLDHYGPDDVAATGGMAVPGHPHTGLQTVSWLFEGEIEHRDTTGVHAMVRPGELNLMTAGSGIAHSEHSTPVTTALHGVQLWVALPEGDRQSAPGFVHHAPPLVDLDAGARMRVLLGDVAGERSPVATYSPLLGAEVTLAAGSRLHLVVDPTFEHGVLVDAGEVEVAGRAARRGELVYLAPGRREIELRAGPGEDVRVMLLGGEPLGEAVVMWWNFLGGSHDEVVAYREAWQAERADPGARPGRFGAFPEAWESTLPAPGLPSVRLRPRA